MTYPVKHTFIQRHIQPHIGLLTILLLYLCLGLLYDHDVPLFEKPDELKHFAVAQHLHTERQLPYVEAGVYRPYDQEGTQPPLYHALVALSSSWLDLSHFIEPTRNPHYVDERSFIWRQRGNNNLYLHAPAEYWSGDSVIWAGRIGRWLSLLMGLITIILTYAIAGLTFSRKRAMPALLSTGFVAFLPQFLHLSTAITNDSLSTTLAAAILFYWALIMQKGLSNRYLVSLGLLLGLGGLTKLSLLYMMPLSGLVVAWRIFVMPHITPTIKATSPLSEQVKQLIWAGLILMGISFLIAGGWYARNGWVYGDITALNAHLLYRGGALDPTPTLGELWQTELTGLELSFWAAFGAGQILLEPRLYELLRGLKYLIFAGLSIGLIRMILYGWRNHSLTMSQQLILLHIFWILTIVSALFRWMQITPASWGRLLFPALPAIAIISVWSLSQFRRQVEPSLQYVMPAIMVVILFGLACVAPFLYLRPAYAKPALQTEADLIGKAIERLDFVYNNELRLLGYQVAQQTARPGDWLHVTLYWQALQPIQQNYSTFVHVLSNAEPNGLTKIGEVNSYPAKGNWPTSMLPVGAILVDTYDVPLDSTASAPAMLRFAIGMFEFDDPSRAGKPALNQAGERVEPLVGSLPLLPHAWPEQEPSQPLTANFSDQISLLGYDLTSAESTTATSEPISLTVQAGQTLPLTLYWQTVAPPEQDLTLFVQLVDQATQTQLAGYDAPPRFPTHYWQTGYSLTDPRPITLPPDLPSGNYTLFIGWYQPDTFVRLPLNMPPYPNDALPLLNLFVK
ncbi:glycosyltransferase family 39 protein [Anaerolineales bacterium HSG6]|nr:glycosyltransferase family 39 protein [Anaerolineales bacterium HSG6]